MFRIKNKLNIFSPQNSYAMIVGNFTEKDHISYDILKNISPVEEKHFLVLTKVVTGE